MRRTNVVAAGILLLLGIGCGGSGGGSQTPTGRTFAAVPVIESVDTPSCLRFAPDGRLFFTELTTGRVRVASGFSLSATPFTTLPVATAGEQGALSMAFDPQYNTNHFVYFCYTDAGAGCDRVVRFTDSANVGTAETVIVDRLPIAGNHNGGRIGFGADGKLYVTIGENGNPANSQNPNVLPGKILRYNPDGTVPGDNPVAGNPMWALGLRNSFGLAFQPGTGTPFVSENGPGCDDEINRIVKGANYGWRPDQPCNDHDSAFVMPLARFNPTIAPTGIAFSTSDAYGFAGGLVMGSYNDGTLREFSISGSAITSQQVLVTGLGHLFDVTEGPDGFLYLASSDKIYRLTILPSL
ncbi:PQQ-dependent sugar dehydrogenase [Fimbriimonas ginsengisoli]|uniref:PQQ-dependent sugar dehydrogenase n=1 Tax=Fimbriimonas ginsengisoli TaxID=1005039 RepID=UPI0003E9570C|nr:PQQ-dependent sugar dehydrogenase [Fimbriimonas ginsengisoli]